MRHLVHRYLEYARDSGHTTALRMTWTWFRDSAVRQCNRLFRQRSKSTSISILPAPPGPLRVLVVCHDYPQLSESYIHAEIRWMLEHGIQIEVVATALPLAPGEALAPRHLGELDAHVACFRPDIIHVHWLSKAWHYADQLDRFDVPVTVRGHGFDHSEPLLSRLLKRPWLQRVYLLPELESRSIDPERCVDIPAIVDTSRYYPQDDKDPRLVLRAGACLPTKDLELFVDVAAMRPEYRFVLALATNHAGARIAQTLRTRNKALGSPVQILFDVPYDEMGHLMRQASIYLHTFGYRQPFGQPISIAEAMACGTIPLLRDSERARAYAGDAGMYYNDAADASERLLQLLALDSARAAVLRARGIARARERHLDDVTMPALLTDWQSLCTRPLATSV